jgi:hypothetical protein
MTGPDLRKWLGEATDAGELQPAGDAHWDLEIGTLS